MYHKYIDKLHNNKQILLNLIYYTTTNNIWEMKWKKAEYVVLNCLSLTWVVIEKRNIILLYIFRKARVPDQDTITHIEKNRNILVGKLPFSSLTLFQHY